MRLFLLVVAALHLSVWGSAIFPSITLCHICPPEDLDHKPLNTTATSLEELKCYYLLFPVLFCTYSRTAGVLLDDEDGQKCPQDAPSTPCATRKRREALPRSPYAPQPGARGIPDTVRVRSDLGKTKRSKTWT